MITVSTLPVWFEGEGHKTTPPAELEFVSTYGVGAAMEHIRTRSILLGQSPTITAVPQAFALAVVGRYCDRLGVAGIFGYFI